MATKVSTPKPWAGARLMKQNRKWHTRRHWSFARWQRYYAERDDKRAQPRRPHLKALREERRAIENYRAHFRALAARRRRDDSGRFMPNEP